MTVDDLLQRWVKVIDQDKCIGCHACTTACKSENEVPLGVTRTYVKSVEVGTFPQVRRAFQVTRGNQCAEAPCTTACPTQAMYRRPDGIVDFDKSVCIGCKACIAGCPYDAIFINPEDNSAEKCNLCAHRLEVGLEPACVTVCPTEAILAGYLSWGSPLARWAAPGIALVFLGITGVLLIWNLRHPRRFYLIFTRHHWRSWLVRGSFIIGGYGTALAAYAIGSLAGSVVLRQVAAGLVLPLALATACYTAYLFAQAVLAGAAVPLAYVDRETRQVRKFEGNPEHLGRPGEDGYTERVLASWDVDGHNSHTNVCSSGGRTGYQFWMGLDRPSPDYAHAKVSYLISAHLETGHYFNPHAQRITQARENGAKVIVLDTRLSNAATHADHWLSPQPGSEAAVNLAIASCLIRTGRYDAEFVRRWWNWEQYLTQCRPDLPPTFEAFQYALDELYAGFTFEYAAADARDRAGTPARAGR